MRYMPWATAVLVAVWAVSLSGHLQGRTTDEEAVVRAVNEAMARFWEWKGVIPSPPASDGEFLRRLYLDLTGSLPPETVAREFLQDSAPDKRQRVIHQLLESEDYARWWATVWRLWLIGRQTQGRQINLAAMEQWLRERLAANVPYNRWVYELLTATGRNDEVGAVNFFLRYDFRPEELAGKTARLFLGKQIQCAQCHDWMDWTQRDFWGMAAYFARVRARPIREGSRIVAVEVWDALRGEVQMERQGQRTVVSPKFLLTDLSLPEPIADRRQQFALFVTHPQNRSFAQAVVNRYWAYFFGRGLVHPVDDIEPDNPPVLPEVLERLTDDFIANGYDLKRLIRVIVSTRAYQLSCQSAGQQSHSPELFAQAPLRPLLPEQLANAILRATGLEEALERRRMNERNQMQRFLTQRLAQVFGSEQVREGEPFVATLPQALLLMNSPQLQRMLQAVVGSLAQRVTNPEASVEQNIVTLFLRFYSRFPTADERQFFRDQALAALRQIAREGNQPLRNRVAAVGQIYEDIASALLNSGEFLFNH